MNGKNRWKTSRTWASGLLAAALAVACACSSRHGLGDNSDCDYLILPETGENLATATLACENSPLAMDFIVNVTFLGPEEDDGGLGEPPEATPLAQFRLEHYDVTYRNLTTGGSVQGVDVPPAFRQSLQEVFDMTEEEELEMTGFPVLVSGAKVTAPLNNDAFYPTAAGVVFEATMTFWGHPVTDDNAWCFANLKWVFSVVPC